MLKRIVCFLLLTSAAFAAVASVGVSSTTVSGNSITVNTAAAHGLSVNQGACLTNGPSCGVVTSTPTGSQFVLLTSGLTPVACSSSCGTASPAPQVIVLSLAYPGQGYVTFNWVNWVTTTQPCPGPTSSAWTNANGSAGATAAETQAIHVGLFIEHQHSTTFATSVPIGNIETAIQDDYASDQANAFSPCIYYGFTFDPTSNSWNKQ